MAEATTNIINIPSVEDSTYQTKMAALIAAIQGLPNATQAAAEAANAAAQAANTAATNISATSTKSGKVITITVTNKDGTATSYTVTDPAGMIAPDFDATEEYNAGQTVDYQGELYKFTADHTGAWTGTDVEATTVEDMISAKANVDGYYENMSVGNAEQLISDVIQTDEVPYVFRPAGGSLEIGNRMFDEMVGGSLNWNQMAKPFVSGGSTYISNVSVSTIESVIDGVCTLKVTSPNRTVYVGTNTSNLYKIPANHKILLNVDVMPSYDTSQTVVGFMSGSDTITAAKGCSENVWTNICGISTHADTMENVSLRVYLDLTSTVTMQIGDTIKIKNLMCIDLTTLFGPTIADYIYTLETSTPGAGVARLKSWGLFTKDYYPFKAVTMEHMQVSAHETIEFNAYNNSTGKAVLLGGNLYQITGAYTALSYTDINGDSETITPDSDGHFTPAKTGTLTVTGGDSTTTCVHLVWDETEDGNFAPFKKHTYALDPIVLRGIPKKDADGNLYFDGDVYSSDGTVERRYAEVDLGSLTWTEVEMSGDRKGYKTSFRNLNGFPAGTGADTWCDSMVSNGLYTQIRQSASSWPAGSYVFSQGGGVFDSQYLGFVTDGSFADAAAFKASMSGVYMIYNLAEPTTEEAAPFQNPQVVDNFGTERYVDYAFEQGNRDFEFPAGHRTEYQLDCKAKIEAAPDSPDADGIYIMQRINGQNSYAPLIVEDELPDAPTTDGTYSLKVTVSDGSATLAWAAD